MCVISSGCFKTLPGTLPSCALVEHSALVSADFHTHTRAGLPHPPSRTAVLDSALQPDPPSGERSQFSQAGHWVGGIPNPGPPECPPHRGDQRAGNTGPPSPPHSEKCHYHPSRLEDNNNEEQGVPNWRRSVDSAPAYGLKGCRFNSQSGNMPGLLGSPWGPVRGN